MADSGINWKMVLAVTAAIVGLGAAAAIYMKRIRENEGASSNDVVDDMLDFVRTKTNELDRLISEHN
ncbi:MAG: hypothetical protein U0R49_04295 [Fimbriimonadales bacterium]